MTYTVEWFRRSVRPLCYSDDQIQVVCDRANAEGLTEALLAVPQGDAIYAISGLLPPEALIEWANASARRASEYAPSSWAAAAARANASVAAAAWAAELRLAIRHGAELLEENVAKTEIARRELQ